MAIDAATLIGLAILAVLGYATALVALWRQPRAIKWFAIALVTVGLGYLATTAVPVSVARAVLGKPV